MRKRLMLALVLALAMASFAVPAKAGTTISISLINGGGEVYDPVFTPRVPLPIAPGATLIWTNKDGAENHQILSYYGQSFASPVLVNQADSFSVTYTGGTLLYRCFYHSTLESRFASGPPVCSGMCGAIHDSSNDPIPPTISITTPNGFVFNGGVRLDGIASDDRAVVEVRVRIIPVLEEPPTLQTHSGFSDALSTLNPCAGCEGPKAAWVFRDRADINTSIPVFSLPPGQYRVEASAFDPQDNEGIASPISIYVLR